MIGSASAPARLIAVTPRWNKVSLNIAFIVWWMRWDGLSPGRLLADEQQKQCTTVCEKLVIDQHASATKQGATKEKGHLAMPGGLFEADRTVIRRRKKNRNRR
jgi:hypothetical protein